MYDLIGYGAMITDKVRTEAYARALHQAIRADSVVLDIGTGTGIFALLACRFGARRVYAVEPSDAIALARETARANGYSERIHFIQGVSERVTLPEPVDIIVSDIRGILPLYQNSVGSIIDARRRLLAPGGVLIPAKDRLMVALVDAPNLNDKHALPWQSAVLDIDMSAGRRFASNTWHNGRATPEQLLVPAKCWGELDYAILDRPGLRGEASWTAERAGTAHGLSVWFDSTLAPGAVYSNAPDQPELVYGSAFFPLSEPVAVATGDCIGVSLRADFVAGDYTWSWNTRIRGADASQAVKADFKQSTFFALPISRAQLHKRAAHFRPTLNEEGEIALLALRSMNEHRDLEDIARELCKRFPARFPDWQTALGHVGALSGDYSAVDGDTNTAAGDGFTDTGATPVPTLTESSNG